MIFFQSLDVHKSTFILKSNILIIKISVGTNVYYYYILFLHIEKSLPI